MSKHSTVNTQYRWVGKGPRTSVKQVEDGGDAKGTVKPPSGDGAQQYADDEADGYDGEI